MKSAPNIRAFVSLLGLAFLLTACGPREIPDDKMEAIIHDIFLVNAYYNLYGSGKIRTDSVDIYTPILEKYGYDAEDFRYSMERMTLRKSSRLSELIDNATADIKAENDFYTGREQIHNRVDTVIYNYYRDTVYRRIEPLRVRSPKMRDSLKVQIPASEGKYRIVYNYEIDSLDKTGYLSMNYKLTDTAGRNTYSNSRGLTRGGKKRLDVHFDATDRADSLLVTLADYRNNAKEISIRIDSLFILYDEPIARSRERFWKDQLGLYARKNYPPDYESIAKDSSTLYLVPPHRPDTAGHPDL